MWISHRHPNPPQPPTPPADDGEPLATIPRGDGRDELRVTLKEYNGSSYVALRLRSRGEGNAFWPVAGKGLSVCLGEVDRGIAAALERARRIISRPPANSAAPPDLTATCESSRASTAERHANAYEQALEDDRPRYVDRRRRPQPRESAPELPRPGKPTDGPFSEF